MSSSRSDDVTKCVCVFVVIFFCLVSLVFHVVLKGFNGVSRKLRMFEVSTMFQASYKGVHKKFKEV